METFYQDGKGHLGLDTYRMRSAEAIGKHWCLVFVAYSLLGFDHRVGHLWPLSMTVGGLERPFPLVLKYLGRVHKQLGWPTP